MSQVQLPSANSGLSTGRPSTTSTSNYTSSVLRALKDVRSDILKPKTTDITKREIAHSPTFDIFFGSVILFNTAFIGVEMELAPETGIHWGFWSVNSAFLVLFLVEILLRLKAEGFVRFFSGFWGGFDTLVTLLGIIDVWIISLIAQSSDSPLSAMTVLRLFRLFRLVRVVRLLRFCRELMMLLYTITDALRAVFWMAIFLFGVVYFGSVLCASLLPRDDENVMESFGTMGRSLFTHFVLVTVENWNETALDVSERVGWPWALYFVAFIVTTNFCLLNMVIAVITKKIMKLEMGDQGGDSAKALEMEQFRDCLSIVLENRDVDLDELLDENKVLSIFEDHNCRRVLETFQVNCSIPFEYLWSIIDYEGTGAVSYDAMIKALGKVRSNEGNDSFQMMLMQSDLHKTILDLKREMKSTSERLNNRLAELENEKIQGLEDALSDLWSVFLRQYPPQNSLVSQKVIWKYEEAEMREGGAMTSPRVLTEDEPYPSR